MALQKIHSDDVDTPGFNTLTTRIGIIESIVTSHASDIMGVAFKIQMQSRATEFNLKYMATDAFSDTTGINTTLSTNYSWSTGALTVFSSKKVAASGVATIIGLPDTCITYPKNIVLEASYSGVITFYYSLDGGITWTSIVPDLSVMVPIPLTYPKVPTIMYKAVIPVGSTLNAVGLAWT